MTGGAFSLCAKKYALVACVVFTACQAQPYLSRASQWEEVHVDNQTVDLWVPDCVGQMSPIILSLHGWGQTKDMQKDVDHFVNYSNPDCAVIAYPTGQERGEFSTGYSWNAGACCPNANRKRNDVQYLDKVIVAAAQKTGANEMAAFVVGISNGAQMAIRLGCESSRVKAVVAVSGLMVNGTGKEGSESFQCNRVVPVLHFHGDADSIIPYYGCNRTTLGPCRYQALLPGWNPLPWAGVPTAMADLRGRNGIAENAAASVNFKNGSTSCTSWGCSANNVTLCTIHGEGHAWPGQCSSWAGKIPGMHCSWAIDASAQILDFFHKYVPRPAATTQTLPEFLAAHAELSTLTTALKSAGLLDAALSGKGPFTVFAPSNDAFAKLGKETLDHLLDPANIHELQGLLEVHVTNGVSLHSCELKQVQNVKTLEGRNLSIVKDQFGVHVGFPYQLYWPELPAKVTGADNDASNAVVHIVDAVLVPPPSSIIAV